MESNNSYTSWADQWDSHPDPLPENYSGGGGGGATAKYSKKVGDGFSKTKVAASIGMQKVKGGASVGLHWIKDKYHKTTQKH